MIVVSLIAFMLLLWGMATRHGSVAVSWLRRLSPPAALARLAAISLVAFYAAQLALLAIGSRTESETYRFAWLKTLPVPVFDNRDAGLAHHALFASVAFALAVGTTIAIAIVVMTLRNRPDALGNGSVPAIACALGLLSLVAPAMSSRDPYEYVATGILGFHSYAPALGAFAGTLYEPYQKLVPLKGVIYGPLWVLVNMAQTSLATSIYWKIEALRLTNVAFVVAFLAVFRRAGASRAALAGFALNPWLWFNAVANPHADIEGLFFLGAAYVCTRRSKTWLAVALIVAAGLIKLPFVIVGGAMLVPLRGKARRVSAWFIAIALVILISYLVPGPAYVRGLSHFAAHRVAASSLADWLVVAATIALATLLLVGFRRSLFGAAWLFALLPVVAAPWYLFWGVPYAIATGTIEIYLVSLPIAASLLDEAAHPEGAWQIVLFVVGMLAISVDLYATTRQREPKRERAPDGSF